ncbi:MAG: RdgB/HAM1 family non-canonical purine NTP pyrophosphatase [Candidatus Cloacimonetes bacterium]|nr:RdgB/HAM1 family non-canonical purine NTP pyrophosphatase [Candidatus Cloacimonadota bacterium]
MKILLGTHNHDKVKEIRAIMAMVSGIEVISIDDLAITVPDVVEDRDTIEGNAIKKASEIADLTGLPTLADDTGLFVRAMNWNPGVYAARYAGENCSYQDNRLKMLEEMKLLNDRYAEFRTVVAFCEPEKQIGTAKGVVVGSITREEFGEQGFGYDAIFRAEESGLTFGEMGGNEKHTISHRGRAFRAILPLLQTWLQKKTQES